MNKYVCLFLFYSTVTFFNYNELQSFLYAKKIKQTRKSETVHHSANSPESPRGRLSDSQAAVQQHGAQAFNSAPLEETRDALALLHHPGNACTRKFTNIRTGTLQLYKHKGFNNHQN